MHELKTSTAMSSRQKLRLVVTLLAVATALLAFEACSFFFTPQLDADQKAIVAWEGVRAPDFTVTTIDGQTIHLADLKGKKVILNFWATWCVPCQVELPDFIKLREETSATNLVMIGLSTEDEDVLKTFVKRNGVNYPIARLKNVPSPYQDVTKIPMTMVIDQNGVIQHVIFYSQDLKALKKVAGEADFSGEVNATPHPKN